MRHLLSSSGVLPGSQQSWSSSTLHFRSFLCDSVNCFSPVGHSTVSLIFLWLHNNNLRVEISWVVLYKSNLELFCRYRKLEQWKLRSLWTWSDTPTWCTSVPLYVSCPSHCVSPCQLTIFGRLFWYSWILEINFQQSQKLCLQWSCLHQVGWKFTISDRYAIIGRAGDWRASGWAF